ncbi:hypothetical protein CTEN210_17207 [Chaetoceros tenuissimus]|uniref:Circumsporozoite protein n=1 Tax=Chaetoceros tenuissimus TaxID=426638 RepID=A0AAD3DA87_9STRA|nr:hypothetical protein CTEN210_17207 [Chaetoceros tenuissimus]
MKASYVFLFTSSFLLRSAIAAGVAIAHKANDSFAACILVMDDNHRIIEWLAYHYHTLPLCRVIAMTDPRSKTSPFSILQRWEKYIKFDLWSDNDIFSEEELKNRSDENMIKLHCSRQHAFNVKCMQTLREEGAAWTVMTDVDEYVCINPLAWNPSANLYQKDIAPIPIDQPGSIIDMLNKVDLDDEQIHAQEWKACIPIAHFQFGRIESSIDKVNSMFPKELKPSILANDFDTFCWRYYGTDRVTARNGVLPGKTLVDVSSIPEKEMKRLIGGPHRPVDKRCKGGNVWLNTNETLRNLDLSTRELAFFRTDAFYATPVDIFKVDKDTFDYHNCYAVIPGFRRFPANDRMMYGPIDAVRIWATQRFSRLEHHISTYELKGYRIHSERYMGHEILPAIRNETGYEVVENVDICFYCARAADSVIITDCSDPKGRIVRGITDIDQVAIVENMIHCVCEEHSFDSSGRFKELCCDDSPSKVSIHKLQGSLNPSLVLSAAPYTFGAPYNTAAPYDTAAPYPNSSPAAPYKKDDGNKASPTMSPSASQSTQPSKFPSSKPSAKTSAPSSTPSSKPSFMKSTAPSVLPSKKPSSISSSKPSLLKSSTPSVLPSNKPSPTLTSSPSSQPLDSPSNKPSSTPTSSPSSQPSDSPSNKQSCFPSSSPSSTPSNEPSLLKSSMSSVFPSNKPSTIPTSKPSLLKSTAPSLHPSSSPTLITSTNPSSTPTLFPSDTPSFLHSYHPSITPTYSPSSSVSSDPSISLSPSTKPSHSPSTEPSASPTSSPTSHPSFAPTFQPSACMDLIDNWMDSSGDTCEWYGSTSSCDLLGDKFADTDGFTAKDICCVCGGGGTRQQRAKFASPSDTSPPTSSPTLSPSKSLPNTSQDSMTSQIKVFKLEIEIGLKGYSKKMSVHEIEVFQIVARNFLSDRTSAIEGMKVHIESVHVDHQFTKQGVTNGIISVNEIKNKGRVMRRLNESGLRIQMTVSAYIFYTDLPEEFSYSELVSSELESDFDLFLLEVESIFNPSTISRADVVNEDSKKYDIKFWSFVSATAMTIVAIIIIFAWDREKNIVQHEVNLFEAVHAEWFFSRNFFIQFKDNTIYCWLKDELTPTEDLQFTEALKQFLLSNKRNDEGIQIFVQSITIDYVIGKQNISNSIVYIHDKVDKDCTLMLSESVKHRLEEVEGATVRVSVQGTVVHSTQLQNEFSFASNEDNNDLHNGKDALCKITVNKRNTGDEDVEAVEEKKTVPPGWCIDETPEELLDATRDIIEAL